MAMGIIESACDFSPDMSKGTVVIECDAEQGNFAKAFDELGTQEARAVALAYASRKGMGSARLNGNVDGPYAVNSKGQPLDEVRGENGKPLPQQHPTMQPARYRITVPVCQPIG